MDSLQSPPELLSLTCTVLLMLLSTHRALQLCIADDIGDAVESDWDQIPEMADSSTANLDFVTAAALHSFWLWNKLGILDGDLGFWVKPRSTTWFSRFLLDQYDDERWVKLFRMTKSSVFALTELLRPNIVRKNTRYRLAIPVVVRVTCTLFKLTHGASLLICSEMFAVSRSSVSVLLRDVVQAVNVVLRSEISWPRGQKLNDIESGFRQLCGLPGLVGAVDGTHVGISKPKFGPADYFYFKSGGYSLNCQAVVDHEKRFLDLFLGMPGSTNDARMLQRSTLYQKASHGTLWEGQLVFNGFTPYLVADAGYPLLPWLLNAHREHSNLPLADALFNRKQRRGRGVVENAFALLKQSFRELLDKSELHVTFLPHVITCCAILHNILQRQSHADVERLLNVLRTEGFDDSLVEEIPQPQLVECIPDDRGHAIAVHKRRELGLHLVVQRLVPQ